MKLVFENYGIRIYENNKTFFIRTDSGELASHEVEIKVSKKDALKAQKGEKEALAVLLKNEQNKKVIHKI